MAFLYGNLNVFFCCCCTYFHGLGSAVQTCPLLTYGGAVGRLGQNSAEGQVMMDELPRSSPSSLYPILLGGPLSLTGTLMLATGSCCFSWVADAFMCSRIVTERVAVHFYLYQNIQHTGISASKISIRVNIIK